MVKKKIVFFKMMIVDGRLGCVSLSFGDKFFPLLQHSSYIYVSDEIID